jgi:SAM-dependent methyltransferase
MPEFFLTIITIAVFIIVSILILALGTSFVVAIFGGGPFVPTPKRSVKRILKHTKISKGQKVYDIGAGDGRFLHFAEKLYGAKATGFEIDPFVYGLARFKQIFFRWKGTIIRDNFQNHSLKDADFVFCYMLPETLKKYRTKFTRELKPSCTIISYTFKIHGWKPFKTIPSDKRNRIKRIYIYKARDNSAKTRTKKKTTSKRT